MLSSGIPSLFHPQLPLFPPAFPPPSHSFLLPLACPRPVWIDPDLLLSSSFPSHSLVLPSHPYFTPPQITSCLYGGSGGVGLIPQACESALSSGLVSRIGSPPLGRSQAALGPARSSLSRRRSSTLGGDGAGNSLGLSWRSWRIQSHWSLSLPRSREIPGP